MRRSLTRRALRILESATLTGALVFGFRFAIVNATTVALTLVVEIAGLSLWGEAEALTGAAAAGLGLDYYFLPPDGLSMDCADYLSNERVRSMATCTAGAVLTAVTCEVGDDL